MASREMQLSGEEARAAIARLLIERVRADKYPSATHMSIIEGTIPRALVRDYLNMLLEKVLMDEHPSIPMLRRIQRIAMDV